MLPPASLQMALGRTPDANLALISTPGEYAAAEAAKALRLGLNVMLFSDNVTIDDEVALKTYGREHGRLVMGPDCGTAIIDGVPLGLRQRGPARRDRRGGRVRHRHAAGDVSRASLRRRNLARDRHRRPRSSRRGRRHHHAARPRRAGARQGNPRDRAHLQAAGARSRDRASLPLRAKCASRWS